MIGTEIARAAKQELSALTGLKPDTVSGMSREDDGWHVTVEMIDLKRIPESTDVLESYEAVLDDDANLVSYQRIRRYLRADVMEMPRVAA